MIQVHLPADSHSCKMHYTYQLLRFNGQYGNGAELKAYKLPVLGAVRSGVCIYKQSDCPIYI